MPIETIPLTTARSLALSAQGLCAHPSHAAGKEDVRACIRRMGLLQIDSIHVVARSPYLVLWSRLGHYNPAWLDELLAEGALFEYWSHAMCFLPIEDYPLYRRFMLDGTRRWNSAAEWVEEHPDLVAQVMERIRREGGLRTADFKSGKRPEGAWWYWKDEKIALECMFLEGELMVARRQAFQRVYDLRSRVYPAWEDGPGAANVPSREQVLETLTLRAVQALGVATADWAAEYFRLPKTGNIARLEALADAGRLQRVEIEGLGRAYRHPSAAPSEEPVLTTVLSPFDPLISDRQRLKDLFGFHYSIETYLPASKRTFGYFTLPILHRGALVGRLDPKAHRADGVFEVKALALEPGVEASDALVHDLAAALRRLAAWHGTPEITLRNCELPALAAALDAG